MINAPPSPQWLEQLLSRTDLHGPKDVRDIEVRLYILFPVTATHGKPEKSFCREMLLKSNLVNQIGWWLLYTGNPVHGTSTIK